MRARWIAWKYDLPEEEVLSVLLRTEITRDKGISTDLFQHLKFSPSLEEALCFLRPKLALRLFQSKDLKKVSQWLALSRSLIEPHTTDSHSIEEQCRWEAESYFMG